MKKAAIFDMDGLMYDTERITAKIWLDVADKMKFKLSKEQCDSFRGSNKEYKRNLFNDWYGNTVNYDEAFKLKQQLLEEYLDKNGVPVKKGLIELLEALKEKNYKIAVATSSSRIKAKKYWESTGVLQYLDASICGDEVTKSKPDPEIFLKASKKINIPISNCIILEDSPNGLKAANLSGATVIMVPDMQKPDQDLKNICDYIFDDLSQVISIL